MPEAVHVASGKVREIYALDDERLLLVASDRISTFDVVLGTPIPDKGRVLTGLSAFWFRRTEDIVPNHLLELRDDGRTTVCRKLDMLPIECVVRGYLAGSGWKDYKATGEVCGHRLPEGMQRVGQVPRADLHAGDEGRRRATTRTSTRSGRPRSAARSCTRRRSAPRSSSIASRRSTRRRAGSSSPTRSSSSGSRPTGRSCSGDEALTPDSSRFWPADEYEPGRPQPSFDKQFVRDWCETTGWDKTPPGPELPDDVVAGTRARYVEAFERLTSISFESYAADPDVVL